MWPDIFHKCARKAAAAIRALDEGQPFLKRLMALFRFSRGPYKSSRFGRTIADARDNLIHILQKNPEGDFVQMWLAGVAKDLASWENAENVGECTPLQLLQELRRRKGLFRNPPVYKQFRPVLGFQFD